MAETLVCYHLGWASRGANDPIAQTKRFANLNSGIWGIYGVAPKALKCIQIQQHLRQLARRKATEAPSVYSGPVAWIKQEIEDTKLIFLKLCSN